MKKFIILLFIVLTGCAGNYANITKNMAADETIIFGRVHVTDQNGYDVTKMCKLGLSDQDDADVRVAGKVLKSDGTLITKVKVGKVYINRIECISPGLKLNMIYIKNAYLYAPEAASSYYFGNIDIKLEKISSSKGVANIVITAGDNEIREIYKNKMKGNAPMPIKEVSWSGVRYIPISK